MPTTPSALQDFGVTFAALQNSMRNYLRRQIDDLNVVEDLLQDVFLKALVEINANRTPVNLTGWLYAVARKTVVDYYRSKQLNLTELDVDFPETLQSIDEQLHQDLAACLRPLVQELPAIYRDTLLATDFDGQTQLSLAEVQGLSHSAIKSRVSRARSLLKDKLLACCHVELFNGVITDYQHRSSSSCRCG